MTRIFVPGGAGYIGSHCCKALAKAGFERDVAAERSPRRPGDPDLTADLAPCTSTIGWSAVGDLDVIVADAWRWRNAPAAREAELQS